mgnify:CR=1 FL=1
MKMKIKAIDIMKNKENAERNASPVFSSIEYLLEAVSRFGNEMDLPSDLITWIEFSKMIQRITLSLIDEASVEELKEAMTYIEAMEKERQRKANE